MDSKRGVLKDIGAGVFLEGTPVFEDLDHDGAAEIFMPARGRDRTAVQGAAILHWTGSTYDVWWPKLTRPAYVIYARLLDVDGDGFKEIVAIVDPKWESDLRQLQIWKMTGNSWSLVAITNLPSVEDGGWALALPTIADVSVKAHRAQIVLNDGENENIGFRYAEGKLQRTKANAN